MKSIQALPASNSYVKRCITNYGIKILNVLSANSYNVFVHFKNVFFSCLGHYLHLSCMADQYLRHSEAR